MRPIVRTASFCVALLLAAGHASAQLISPGKLIEAHAALDQIDSCTKCHSLGKRSVDSALCLDCHIPLKNRIEANAGLHGTLKDRECATCHKDHFGREFDPVRFDTTAFRHDVIGFELKSSHADLACVSCHTERNVKAPEVRYYIGKEGRLGNTFLGLEQSCESCHQDDSKHGNQFREKTCQTCHDETKWDAAPNFNHSNTSYPLTGKHLSVSCVDCHGRGRPAEEKSPLRYDTITSTNCSTCHRDVHAGAMGPTCTNCHATSGWNASVSTEFERSFDHSKTGFVLNGTHGSLACRSCHNPPRSTTSDLVIRFPGGRSGKTYPKPAFASCASCHRDPHAGEFTNDTGAVTCTSCHGEVSWAPSSFDAIRHVSESGFALTGAHLGVLCDACHVQDDASNTIRFSIENATCAKCHQKIDPHRDELLRLTRPPPSCETCHSTQSWSSADVTFDHGATRFPLENRHGAIACDACHRKEPNGPIRLVLEDISCESCHAGDDPHEGQFTRVACSTCHDTVSFKLASFDHDRTSFKLDAVHAQVACSQCHTREISADGREFVRFRPLGMRCEDCHS